MRSHWREFQFAFHQAQAAILPRLSLQATFEQWNQISTALSEPTRKRKSQVELSQSATGK